MNFVGFIEGKMLNFFIFIVGISIGLSGFRIRTDYTDPKSVYFSIFRIISGPDFCTHYPVRSGIFSFRKSSPRSGFSFAPA
jgi:hypothetical protein